jgi:hypothetical protein
MAIVAKVLIKGTQRNHLPSQRKTYSHLRENLNDIKTLLIHFGFPNLFFFQKYLFSLRRNSFFYNHNQIGKNVFKQ